ncbi:hypothetical protein TVNIR_1981 [Thioalkalivibrio nitratireducens DSM 14787]|uniref:Uncharacterized protein n=1 Tax=Thioalkalivibrio nitratireducens (strain DSM 14787 / UNIQEM 213 / ALEN2) TaxID=1255043 RepID=L0DXA9_THIND|nr:hypothetical protein TVNIR_1981 [Thioalkalivibrio nitratireducens DSM 14787]
MHATCERRAARDLPGLPSRAGGRETTIHRQTIPRLTHSLVAMLCGLFLTGFYPTPALADPDPARPDPTQLLTAQLERLQIKLEPWEQRDQLERERATLSALLEGDGPEDPNSLLGIQRRIDDIRQQLVQAQERLEVANERFHLWKIDLGMRVFDGEPGIWPVVDWLNFRQTIWYLNSTMRAQERELRREIAAAQQAVRDQAELQQELQRLEQRRLDMPLRSDWPQEYREMDLAALQQRFKEVEHQIETAKRMDLSEVREKQKTVAMLSRQIEASIDRTAATGRPSDWEDIRGTWSLEEAQDWWELTNTLGLVPLRSFLKAPSGMQKLLPRHAGEFITRDHFVERLTEALLLGEISPERAIRLADEFRLASREFRGSFQEFLTVAANTDDFLDPPRPAPEPVPPQPEPDDETPTIQDEEVDPAACRRLRGRLNQINGQLERLQASWDKGTYEQKSPRFHWPPSKRGLEERLERERNNLQDFIDAGEDARVTDDNFTIFRTKTLSGIKRTIESYRKQNAPSGVENWSRQIPIWHDGRARMIAEMQERIEKTARALVLLRRQYEEDLSERRAQISEIESEMVRLRCQHH